MIEAVDAELFARVSALVHEFHHNELYAVQESIDLHRAQPFATARRAQSWAARSRASSSGSSSGRSP
jgi:hypothetical protein